MSFRFGADIGEAMGEWWVDSMIPEIFQKYGATTNLSVAVLSTNPELHNWEHPQDSIDFELSLGEESKIEGSEGLKANVLHKLRFVLRTGLPSSQARTRPDLLEPGDFPYAGAGTYKGYTGGACGLTEESDWWVFCRVIDRLIELRSATALRAIQASKDRVPGMKYMPDDSNDN